MSEFRRLCRVLACPMAVVILFASMPVRVAGARMVATDQIIGEAPARADRARVLDFLKRDDVRAQMVRLEVDPDEAMTRTANLSDQEIRRIADHVSEDPAGQSAVGVVVGAVVLIFLVLLVTDLLGLTDVYPFVTKRR